MPKTISLLFIIVNLSACSVVPESVVSRDATEIQGVTDFELCRAAWDFDISENRFRRSPIPDEMLRRELSFDSCFEMALDEYGVESVCTDYNRAVWQGKASALIGFGWDMGREDLERELGERQINCYTDDYIAKKGTSSSSALDKASRSFMDSQIERLNSKKTSTTHCTSYYEGSVTCRTY